MGKVIKLKFEGPASFRYDSKYIFQQKGIEFPGIYLWTIRSNVGDAYYTHYVGETGRGIDRRHWEHLIHMLGLNYGIWDVGRAREGKEKRVWQGFWRLPRKKFKGVINKFDIIKRYKRLHKKIVSYVESIDIFFANTTEEVTGEKIDTNLRKYIESVIAKKLRDNPDKQVCAVYPQDNVANRRMAPRQRKLLISFKDKTVIVKGLNNKGGEIIELDV